MAVPLSSTAVWLLVLGSFIGGCFCECNGKQKRPQINGHILTKNNASAIAYVIIEGCGYGIPNWQVYDNLFRNRSCAKPGPLVENYCICETLDANASFGRDRGKKAVYLLANGQKRAVPSLKAAAKYCFSLDHLQEWEPNGTIPIVSVLS